MASGMYHDNEHNCTDADRLLQRHFLPVAYGVIFCVGLLGNVTSLFIYATKLRPWKSSHVIMANLALTDLLHVLSMPFLVYYYASGDSWTLGDFMCRLTRFGFHINLYASIFFLTCMAVFRCVAVLDPLRAVQRKQWGIAACAVVWAAAVAETAPMLDMIHLDHADNKSFCLDFASSNTYDGAWWYGWLLTALGFLLPLAVVAACYVGMAKELAKGPLTSSRCRVRAQRMTVLILVVFVVCFLPYHVLRMVRIYTRKNPENPCELACGVNAAYIVSRPLATLNTFFNLGLYTLAGDKFHKAFLRMFHLDVWLAKAKSNQLAVVS